MQEISYLPGTGTVLVSNGIVLLVEAQPDAEISSALWRLISEGANHDRVRAFLESYGPDRLPGMGLASLRGDGASLLLRGSVSASAIDAVSGQATDYADTDGRRWTEHFPADATRLVLWLRDPGPSVPALTLVGGVALADAVLVTLDGAVTAPVSAASPAAVAAPVPVPPPVPAPVPVQEPPVATPSAPPAAARGQAPVAVPAPPLAGLFVERTEPAPVPAQPQPRGSIADVFVTAVAAEAPAAAVTPAAPPSTPTPAAPTPSTPPPPAVPPMVAPAPPPVWAVHCPQGHPNAPDAPACRICGSSIVDRTPVVIARPPLGRLDFSALGWVPLDHDLLIGRDPGAQPPHGPRPVVIDHPSLSQQHIEVRLHEWTLHVIDLDSQHGTTIVAPGRPAQHLRARQPEPLVPGTVIWLGQQVPCTYVPY